MTKKLVWPATFLVAFALAAACGGGSTDGDGMGGEGGKVGSGGGDTLGSGGSTGGQSVGGEGGLGGNAPVVVAPLTCSDGEQNESETDVDCGGPDCDPCDDDASCVEPTDCESGVCADGACNAPECGDRVVNGDEECDPGRETDDCDEDCTFTVCGDGYLNRRVEDCEQDPDLGSWQRCGRTCIVGADLDGTWREDNLPGASTPWESLTSTQATYGGYVGGLQSFHYASATHIYDLTGNQRYDIKDDEWSALPNSLPYYPWFWENAAVDAAALWVPRDSSMFRLDLETLEWTRPSTEIPDGGSGVTGSAAVYDGDGFIWYVGTDTDSAEDLLVKYDPGDGTFETFSWATTHPAYTAYEPRVAYDPVTNQVAFASYSEQSSFLVFDLANEVFTQGMSLPDAGTVTDNTCQDRAGGVYVTSSTGTMFRYDIALDTYEQLPPLPAPNDSASTCVVSEVGYLYYGSLNADPATGKSGFLRLRLNHR